MNAHELYQQEEVPGHYTPLLPCPVCGAPANMWRFSMKPNDIIQHVGMCTHNEQIGGRDGIVNEGCLLSMPPEDFYKPTIREALKYWNDFAEGLIALRKSNSGGEK